MNASESLTDLLQRASAGDASALDAAFPLVYEQLRQLAHRQLSRESPGHTLDTTSLVHEAYLRLVDQNRGQWRDRAHFMAISAMAMRRILVDHARRHGAVKRGAGVRPLQLENIDALAVEERADMLVALDDALARLATFDARQAKVVECRFFGGLTEEETAEVMSVSARTIKRDWAKARAWLYQELYPDLVE